ncbi:MAG: class I SAM-dependent methyltransferase [Azospirillaceae bacterium]|nr:class I SAM-dependent methyltransferase [Azospirillaceae bacterium]
MTKKPRASILIPVWNCGRYIEVALRSVFSQVDDDMEVLIFDDASTDGTFACIQQTVRDFGRGMVIINRQPYNQVYPNFREALAAVGSDIIILVHGDDVSLPGRFERILSVFADPEILLVSSNAIITDALGHHQRLHVDDTTDQLISDPRTDLETLFVPNMLGATLAYRRRLITEISFHWDLFGFDDMVLPFRAQLLGKRYFIGEPLIEWRIHGANGHLRLGAGATDEGAAETYQGILLNTLVARRRDIDAVIAQAGATPILEEVRRRFAVFADNHLEQWAQSRSRLMIEGSWPTWQRQARVETTPGRTGCFPAGVSMPCAAGTIAANLVAALPGWQQPELWGVWSDQTAIIDLTLAGAIDDGAWVALDVVADRDGPQGGDAVEIVIACHDEELWVGTLTERDGQTDLRVFVPARLMPAGRIILDLSVTRAPGAPQETPDGATRRKRGLGLVALTVRPARNVSLPDALTIPAETGVPGWFSLAEASLLMACVACFRPHLTIEIGSFAGRSSLFLHQALRQLPGRRDLVCVDTWQTMLDDAFLSHPFVGDMAAAFPGSWAAYVETGRGRDSSALFAKTLADWPDFAEMTERRREDSGFVDFGSRKAGLVFIDGGHTRAEVHRDFMNMAAQLQPGAVVLFHDYGGDYPDIRTFVDSLISRPQVRWLRIVDSLVAIQIMDPVTLVADLLKISRALPADVRQARAALIKRTVELEATRAALAALHVELATRTAEADRARADLIERTDDLVATRAALVERTVALEAILAGTKAPTA